MGVCDYDLACIILFITTRSCVYTPTKKQGGFTERIKTDVMSHAAPSCSWSWNRKIPVPHRSSVVLQG